MRSVRQNSGNQPIGTAKKNFFKWGDLRDFWDNIKHTNFCIIVFPKERKEQKIYLNNNDWKRPKPAEIDIKGQEAQRFPNKIPKDSFTMTYFN